MVPHRSFACGCAALNSYTAKSLIFSKIFAPRVCSICQYLILWQRAVRPPQCGLRSVTLDSLPGSKYGDRHGIWATGLLTPPDRTKQRSDRPGRRDVQIWGQTRCPTYRSGTFNVQRSTFNGVSERAHGGRDMGQTRSYGDTYDLVLPVCTVESVSAVPVIFFRKRGPGGGDEVEADNFPARRGRAF